MNSNFFSHLIKLSKKAHTRKGNMKNKYQKNRSQKNKSKSREYFQNNMLNIYNEPLQNCGDPSMNTGSWDSEYKCSEKKGGVHQICINQIARNAKNFSYKTGQSKWSNMRGNDNHCVCLGAWSLYNAKNSKANSKSKKNNSHNTPNRQVLKCDAIPKISLSDDYVSKFSQGWNKWNGYELDDQIVHGVNSMVNNCYYGNDTKSKNLRNNYCSFGKNVKSLKNSKLYKKLC